MSEELLMRIQEMAARIKELERDNAELKTLLQTAIEQHEIAGKLHQHTIEAGVTGDMRPIKDLDDLLWVMEVRE
jgi:TolA-binding protein